MDAKLSVVQVLDSRCIYLVVVFIAASSGAGLYHLYFISYRIVTKWISDVAAAELGSNGGGGGFWLG